MASVSTMEGVVIAFCWQTGAGVVVCLGNLTGSRKDSGSDRSTAVRSVCR